MRQAFDFPDVGRLLKDTIHLFNIIKSPSAHLSAVERVSLKK